MSEYLVTKREPCTKCGETGMVVQHLWKVFFETFPSWPEPEAEIEFWRERGWFKSRPDEEILCPECEGGGVIETEISLLDALIELGVTLPAATQ